MAVGALAAVGLAGCGATAHPPSPRRSAVAPARVRGGPPSRRAPSRAALARRSLQRALAQPLRGVQASGAAVYDLTDHRVLFAHAAQVARPPASVEKLYTTVAVLSRLGPSARLTTTVLGTGHLGHTGTWHGRLYLRGGGDPTLGDGAFNRTWNDGLGPTAAELASQLAARGIRRVTGRVVGDSSLFDSSPGGPNSGFAPDITDLGGELAGLVYDHGATAGALSPGAFAARELALTMRNEHIRARARRVTAAVPGGAQRLAAVGSPTMLSMLGLMNLRSDDFFAEILTKQLGVRFGRGGTTAAGARVVSAAMAHYGLQPSIVDGSGLSRADRSSPQQVVSLLRSIWHTAVGRELVSTLPVVGVSGTTAHIGVHTRAQGRCRAKTGTLDGVTNLAGYCQAAGSHTLAFALFLDGPTLDQARALLTRLVGAIAGY